MNKTITEDIVNETHILIDSFKNNVEKLRFQNIESRIGSSQHYIISELEKIGEDKYLIAEERVLRTDIVFLDQKEKIPIIALEYEQSGRYLETIQKMKRVSNCEEGQSLKILVFSFWYEDAAIKLKLLKKIQKDLIECSLDNGKIWILLGLSFPHISFSLPNNNLVFISKSKGPIGPLAPTKSRMYYKSQFTNLKLSERQFPIFYYNGYLIEIFFHGENIFHNKKFEKEIDEEKIMKKALNRPKKDI
jgi:hypothetical protein